MRTTSNLSKVASSNRIIGLNNNYMKVPYLRIQTLHTNPLKTQKRRILYKTPQPYHRLHNPLFPQPLWSSLHLKYLTR